jgi:hypothetical protein
MGCCSHAGARGWTAGVAQILRLAQGDERWCGAVVCRTRTDCEEGVGVGVELVGLSGGCGAQDGQ